MIDVEEKKEKILTTIKETGPTLPVRIAKAIEMDPVFASAILSELLSAKKLKLSNLRVGSSSLYLLPGQEKKLEEYSDNLKSAEKEAYLKLKERIVLIDEDEEPATRVALRNIKDFAAPFKHQEKIIWKYIFSTQEQVRNALEDTGAKNKQKIQDTSEKKEKEKSPEAPDKQKKENKENKKEKEQEGEKNRVENIFEEEPQKNNPEFLSEVKAYLEKNNIELLEEIKTEKKEIIARIYVPTAIGKIAFLLIAKNKQTTNKEEIGAALQQAAYNKVPCLMLIKKEPSNTIKKLLEENNLIRIEII